MSLCLFKKSHDGGSDSDLVALACLVPLSRAMDIDDVPPVDLDAIVASYAPNAAIARLLFVADRAKARDAPEDDEQPAALPFAIFDDEAQDAAAPALLVR